MIWKVYTCEYLHVNKEVLTVSARNGTDICELHTMGLYTKASVISKMHTCEYLHVHKEVLTVSARKGIDICDFPHRGFLYKSVHHTIYESTADWGRNTVKTTAKAKFKDKKVAYQSPHETNVSLRTINRSAVQSRVVDSTDFQRMNCR